MKKLAFTIAAAALVGFAGSAVAADPQDGCLGAATTTNIDSVGGLGFGEVVSGAGQLGVRGALVQLFLSDHPFLPLPCDPPRGSLVNPN